MYSNCYLWNVGPSIKLMEKGDWFSSLWDAHLMPWTLGTTAMASRTTILAITLVIHWLLGEAALHAHNIRICGLHEVYEHDQRCTLARTISTEEVAITTGSIPHTLKACIHTFTTQTTP